MLFHSIQFRVFGCFNLFNTWILIHFLILLVSAKIRNLQDYHHRLLNGITPYPSIPDIINVLKFFSQALLTILRDVPCIPIDLIRDPNRDSIRIGFFPNLDYRNLFYTLSGMLDSFSNIQSALSSNAPSKYFYLLSSLTNIWFFSCFWISSSCIC